GLGSTLTPPSPNSQKYAAILFGSPVETKFTIRGASPLDGLALKLASAGGIGAPTLITISAVLLPPGPVTVRVTVYSPGCSKRCSGSRASLTGLPSPKSHSNDRFSPIV